MQKLGVNEIREKYLSFFESKGHLRLPSAPLVPQNDPSLLLINSGMAPLKPYFTGAVEPPRKRVTTCQKCIRTPDIDNVGKTARHGTFFEMLGNFSFGDYFKEEIIPWAWEFITKTLEIPEDRLYITVYEDDDEAADIWHKKVGVNLDRIIRMGKEDNFWEIGTGPCGPCSEIYYDRGADKGCGKPDCKFGCDCDRYMEFWNLVFTQFDRDAEGNYNRLTHPNIDTGMGLERMAVVMQDVNSLFEIDTVKNVLDYVGRLASVKYGDNYKTDVSLRIIADHIRGTTFMISDGVLPSNEGRGYVLRRLIRRAARQGKLLGIKDNFLNDICNVVINASKDAYPELLEKEEYIKKIIKIEEEKFSETIDQGIEILNEYIKELKIQKQTILSGKYSFKLYDTYGFPPDLTTEILQEHGMKLDEAGFKEEMQKQKQMGKKSWVGAGEIGWDNAEELRLDKDIKTEFTGYGSNNENSRILAIVKNNKALEYASEGDEIGVILDITPFYAQSGGQVGDTGVIKNNSVEIEISDTQKVADGKILHIGKITKGEIKVSDKVEAIIDNKRRMAISRNHSATHLLQKALREVLGTHVAQAGSLVEPEKLRFDFSHFQPMTQEELNVVEQKVNEKVLESLDVETKTMSIDEARKMGAMALFGEKYGKIVRLVKMEDYSLELCGGCHVRKTSQIGLFKIVSEVGIASGVRRIEGITGNYAFSYMTSFEERLSKIAQTLKCNVSEVITKAEGIVNELKVANKEIENLNNKMAAGGLDDILKNVEEKNGIKYIAARFDILDMDGLRNMADNIRNKIGSGVVVLASSKDDKVSLVAAATKDVLSKGVNCGNIIREVAKATGGGGGGRPDMAQAGGKDPSKIDDALKLVSNLI